MDKKQIRADVIEKRRMLSDEERMEKSVRILKKLDKQDAFLKAWKVALYASDDREVITYPLINRAQFLDKGVSFPKVTSNDQKEMTFLYVLSVSDLKPGFKGILEPDASATVMERPDLIIMPLVAFDPNRNRIGQGGGYYDRYLKEHPDIFTIALAFECQKVDRIPAEEWDIRPNMIITENSIYE